MEIRQLAYFKAVAEHRSFTRAAEELNLVQSGVSQQVRRLEAELGVDLLRRSTRHVELTEEGRVVLETAGRVQSEIESLRSELARRDGRISGRLAVGGMLPAGGVDLPALLVEFTQLHPDVELELHEGTAGEMLTRLRAGTLDMAIAMLESADIPAGCKHRVLGHERIVVAMQRDTPLATRKALRLDDLNDERLVSFRRGSAIRAAIDGALDALERPPRISFETNDLSIMRSVTARGLAAALVPESVAKASGPDVVWRPLRPSLGRSVSLVWRAGRPFSPAAAEFAAQLRAA